MKKSSEQTQLSCPYCEKRFDPEDILFCDPDGDRVIDDQQQYDPQYSSFLSGIIPFVRVQNDSGSIVEMAKRRKYFFHPWSSRNCDASRFHEPEKMEWDEQNNLYPSTITVVRNHGLTPSMLTAGKQGNPSTGSEKQKKAEEKNESEDFDGIRRGTARRETEGPSFSADTTSKLRIKACPHCHCVLPDKIGIYPMHRIGILGSKRAGKTTYMTLTAHQLDKSVGLPKGLVQSFVIGDESMRYFDYLINCMKAGVLPSTPMLNNDKTQVVFPIVITITPQADLCPYILVINDCPGEAMSSGAYLDNFSPLTEMEGIILIMDPCQFTDAPKEKANNTGNLKNHIDICDVSFNKTLAFFTDRIMEYKKLRQIAMVLTKLDLVYGSGEESLIQHKKYPHIDEGDLCKQHDDGMDLDWIAQLDFQVRGAISSQLAFPDYDNRVQDIVRKRPDVNVSNFCCSTRSWNDAEKKFIAPSTAQDAQQNVNMIGYRLLEPLLFIMAKSGWLPAKTSIETKKPISTGFWRWFRK